MRREDLPEEKRKLEEDVCDVENGGKPRVLVRRKMQGLVHTRDLCVTNVASVEERQHVCLGQLDLLNGRKRADMDEGVSIVSLQRAKNSGIIWRSSFRLMRESAAASCTTS